MDAINAALSQQPTAFELLLFFGGFLIGVGFRWFSHYKIDPPPEPEQLYERARLHSLGGVQIPPPHGYVWEGDTLRPAGDRD